MKPFKPTLFQFCRTIELPMFCFPAHYLSRQIRRNGLRAAKLSPETKEMRRRNPETCTAPAIARYSML
ncbi:MAG: hypothetical protein ACOC3T_03705 [Bacteroidota bacterium]